MKNKQNNRAHTASVQTARATSPYKVLDRYVPLSKPEFAVYDAIREAVPMVDAAILKIVRLVDNFNISSDNSCSVLTRTSVLSALLAIALKRLSST